MINSKPHLDIDIPLQVRDGKLGAVRTSSEARHVAGNRRFRISGLGMSSEVRSAKWRRKTDDAHEIRDKSKKVNLKVKMLKSLTRLSKVRRKGIYIRRSRMEYMKARLETTGGRPVEYNAMI